MTYNLQKNTLKGTVSATLHIQTELHPALQGLRQDKTIKQSFVALLYISLEHLSLPLVQYLEQHNIDLETVKNKLDMLVHNAVISDM
jgi:hypothetical protein